MHTASDSVTIKYYLKFDNSIGYGSPEHFFHFMWGYLLPALNEILNIESHNYLKRVSKVFFVRSCGPVMNELLDEMFSLYNCNFEIFEQNDLDAANNFATIMVPRWDIWLRTLAEIKDFQSRSKYRKINLTNISIETILRLLKNRKNRIFKWRFLASIQNVKRNTNYNIHNSLSASKINRARESYLIIKRSQQPTYYKTNGKAEVPTYGTARRALVGIEDALRDLRNNGISAEIFEPGKHSLAEQVMKFGNCRGIIGIRGAEFANLIWMKRRSKVIMIRPLNMTTPLVQEQLAVLMGLKYTEITTSEGSYPRLSADLILKYLIR